MDENLVGTSQRLPIADWEIDQFRALPKVELHCHLLGAIPATTVIDLARKHSVDLRGRTETNLYTYFDFLGLVDVLCSVAAVLREHEDFSRVIYELLKLNYERDNIQYSEIFFQPSYHALVGVPYAVVQDGLVDGIAKAESDFGVQARLIAGLNRQLPPHVASLVVESMLAKRSEYVIGIGLEDYEPYWRAGELSRCVPFSRFTRLASDGSRWRARSARERRESPERAGLRAD